MRSVFIQSLIDNYHHIRWSNWIYPSTGLCKRHFIVYQTCNLVVSSQARHWWMAGAIYAWKCQKQIVCWLKPEWRVQCESARLPRLLLTVAHDPGSHFTGVSYRMSLGKPVCRWPGHHYWTAGGIKQKLILWKTNMEWKGLWVTMGKTKVLISGPGLDMPQKSPKTNETCVSRASAQIPFSVVVVPVWSTRKAVASIVVWGLMPPSGVNGALDRPDQLMADLWQKSESVGRSLRWCHPSVTSWMLIRRAWLWTRYYHMMTCHMRQLQRTSASPYLPLISHHLQWDSLQFVWGVSRSMQEKPGT